MHIPELGNAVYTAKSIESVIVVHIYGSIEGSHIQALYDHYTIVVIDGTLSHDICIYMMRK